MVSVRHYHCSALTSLCLKVVHDVIYIHPCSRAALPASITIALSYSFEESACCHIFRLKVNVPACSAHAICNASEENLFANILVLKLSTVILAISSIFSFPPSFMCSRTQLIMKSVLLPTSPFTIRIFSLVSYCMRLGTLNYILAIAVSESIQI